MYRNHNDGGSRGGAEHLARIHGTEEDKVNCPFYFKIGACRHGDKCSRQHHKPPFSQTIIVPHMWAVSTMFHLISLIDSFFPYFYALNCLALSTLDLSFQNPFSTAAMMGSDPSQLDKTKVQDDVRAGATSMFEASPVLLF